MPESFHETEIVDPAVTGAPAAGYVNETSAMATLMARAKQMRNWTSMLEGRFAGWVVKVYM